MFDAIQFCNDHNIDYAKSGKYFRRGWTNVRCPFCHSSKHTLGICHNGMTSCYKCGGKHINNVIWALSNKKPGAILNKYKTGESNAQVVKMAKTCKLPNCESLTYKHAQYLKGRGFDPYDLVYRYNVLSAKDYTKYSNRIIIPIFFKGRIVSYQGRAVNDSKLRYKACKEKNEVVKHKRTLYNIDNCGDRVVVVEGIFDTWRIGNNSVCTFGISYTSDQIELLADFKKVFILFDSEYRAQEQAEKLFYDLKFLNVDVETVDIGGDYTDPGEMSIDEVKYLKKTLDI